MAGAVRFPGLDESRVLVVGPADAGERRQYRRLVRAVSRASAPAGWRCRQHGRHRAHAAVLRGLCFRLRLQVISAARRRSADLPVRHLVVERSGRPDGGDRGRDRFCGAMGDSPAPARHHDRGGNDRECRVGDRPPDPDRGMPVMVCGADQELSRQRHRKFAVGGCLLHHRRRSLPPAARIPWCGSRAAGHQPSQALRAFWRF